jgi:hypothetical protein
VHLWVEIAARELAALAALIALGIGPASFLGRRFDAAARLAIAPALGLCLATCVFTTLIWFVAADSTYWLLPVIAAVSVAVALRRSFTAAADAGAGEGTRTGAGARDDARRVCSPLRRLRTRDALALAGVCVLVAAPLSFTLHERGTVGPMGFLVLDSDGYTATADGMEQLSIRQVLRPAARDANLVRWYWKLTASSPHNVDGSPLAANLELLMGLHATDTQSLFLIVFLVTGALGAFAAVRYLAPQPGWVAALAGALFAGPLFLQLLADGSQAATCGLAVSMALATVGVELLRHQRPANLILFALLASGLMALYPLYLPGAVLVAVAVLVAIAIRGRLSGRLGWRAVRRAALLAAMVAALTAAFNVVSFARDVRYWLETVGGEDLAGKPIYDLPLQVLPGWVLQTRQFYVLQTPPLRYLINLTQAPAVEVLGETILPAIMIAAILFGLWRNRRGVIFASIVLVFAAFAEYASATQHCSYCVDRYTLASAPTSIVLLALGIAALATARFRWMRWSAIGLAVATVIAVGAQTWTERQLFAAEAYYLGGGERTLVSDLPAHAGPVDLEGFGDNVLGEAAVAELPLVYTLAYEHNHGEVSLPSEYSDDADLSYFGGPNTRDPRFVPDYRYVLTRRGGVETGRRVIARAGPLALEERRTGALDVTITSGAGVGMVRHDTTGQPTVVGPLRLLVSGAGSAPAWILLRFRTLAPAGTLAEPHLRARATAHSLTVCVEATATQATGAAPVRKATVWLTGTIYAGAAPTEAFGFAGTPRGITLVAMRALRHC